MTDTKFTEQDTQTIFHGDHEDFSDAPVAEYVVGEGRWHDHVVRIYKHADGTLWGVEALLGKTEMQENEYRDAPFVVTEREETQVVRVHYSDRGARLGCIDTREFSDSEL